MEIYVKEIRSGVVEEMAVVNGVVKVHHFGWTDPAEIAGIAEDRANGIPHKPEPYLVGQDWGKVRPRGFRKLRGREAQEAIDWVQSEFDL